MDRISCTTERFFFDRVRLEHPRREDYNLHAHTDYELLYIIEGRGHFLVEGRQYPLERDCVMIMRPGEIHKLLIDETAPYERVCINFRPELLLELESGGLLLEAYEQRPMGERNRYTLPRPELLMSIMPGSGEKASLELTVQLFLLQCLYEIRRQFGARKQSSGKPLPLEAPLTFINDHLGAELSLQSVADRFYISPAQLNRLMKRSVGTTFWNYVLVKRLLAAKHLLHQGVPAGEAARKCGFGEYSAFYRAYKKQFGIAPHADQKNTGGISEDFPLG